MTVVTRGRVRIASGPARVDSRGFSRFRDSLLTSATLNAGTDATADARARHDRAFLGHPAGLGWLSFCELWERFSYYGMQALLVLYLSNYLFMPENIGVVAGMDTLRRLIEGVTGSRSTQQLASVVFGLYTGFVYLTPIFGGLLADRVLGRTKTIVIGALLMALGHFLMAVEAALLPALGCLLLGVGCFKGNIAAQVGDLYAPGDKRRASAFQIFMLAVQIAVIAAPIVCGTLGERVGWHWGFGAAGVGMLIGLVVYLAGRRFLPPETKRSAQATAEPLPPLGRRGVMQVVLLVAILPLLMLSIVGNQQFNNAYPLWSQKYMDMNVGSFAVPVTWLQAVDATVSFITMLGSIAFWRWWSQRRREPDEVTKMALGSFVAACAPLLLLIPAMSIEAGGGKISILWTFAYTLVNDIGFANILPVGLALYRA
jgi:POT family proton-dependent oligopeptide transporter